MIASPFGTTNQNSPDRPHRYVIAELIMTAIAQVHTEMRLPVPKASPIRWPDAMKARVLLTKLLLTIRAITSMKMPKPAIKVKPITGVRYAAVEESVDRSILSSETGERGDALCDELEQRRRLDVTFTHDPMCSIDPLSMKENSVNVSGLGDRVSRDNAGYSKRKPSQCVIAIQLLSGRCDDC